MEISQESFERYQKASQNLEQKIVELTADLAKAKEKLEANTELLNNSNEDIHVLMAFIVSRGLQPPRIKSTFLN